MFQLRDENSNLKSQNNEIVESNRNFKSRLSENSRALNELNLLVLIIFTYILI